MIRSPDSAEMTRRIADGLRRGLTPQQMLEEYGPAAKSAIKTRCIVACWIGNHSLRSEGDTKYRRAHAAIMATAGKWFTAAEVHDKSAMVVNYGVDLGYLEQREAGYNQFTGVMTFEYRIKEEHMPRIMLVGGDEGVHRSSTVKKMKGYGLDVEWLWCRNGTPAIPDACEGVIVLRDLVKSLDFDVVRQQCKTRGIPYLSITHKFSQHLDAIQKTFNIKVTPSEVEEPETVKTKTVTPVPQPAAELPVAPKPKYDVDPFDWLCEVRGRLKAARTKAEHINATFAEAKAMYESALADKEANDRELAQAQGELEAAVEAWKRSGYNV